MKKHLLAGYLVAFILAGCAAKGVEKSTVPALPAEKPAPKERDIPEATAAGEAVHEDPPKRFEQTKQSLLARGSPLGYALNAVGAEKYEHDKIEALVKIAKASAAVGDKEACCVILLYARTLAEKEAYNPHGSLGNIAEAYFAAGFNDKAYELAKTYGPYGLLKQIAQVYSQEKKFDDARKEEEFLEESYEKADALLELVEKYLQAGKIDAAYKLAAKLEDTVIKIDVLVALAELTGWHDRSLEVAESMGKDDVKARALADMASLFAAAGNKDKADDVLSLALEKAGSIDDVWSRAKTLGHVAEKFAQAGKKDKAAEIMEKALAEVEAKYQTDTPPVLLQDLAEACVKIGQESRAFVLAAKVKDKLDRSEILGAIARALIQAGRIDEALKAVKKCDAIDRDMVLSDLAEYHAKAGRVEEALKTVKKISDSEERIFAIIDIAEICGKAGKIDQMNEVLALALQSAKASGKGGGPISGGPIVMGVMSDKMKFMTMILDTSEKTGHKEKFAQLLEKALELAGSFPQKDHRALALAYIAGKLREAGLEGKCLEVLAKASAAAKKIKNEYDRAWALLNIVDVYAEAGKFDTAMEITKKIPREKEKFWALLKTAEEAGKAGKKDVAANALLPAFDIVKAIEQRNEKAEAFIEVALLLSAAGTTPDGPMKKIMSEIDADFMQEQ
jgi:ribosomal protein S7